MDHADHIVLIREGVPKPGGVWADFGSGTGAFTLALADLIGPQATLYSIDQKAAALRQQQTAVQTRFPTLQVHYRTADFSQPLDLPPLDGVIMANALHFEQHKDAVLQQIFRCLRPYGRFILVEYNVDRGNLWVPHPLSFTTWQQLARRHGFVETRLLATRPSSFLREIYAAVSLKP
ncbi:MAG: class I SAM-dependent methyltransferase [Anaerolineaceae bacterium]|nr:class I SAM-dependent methyltransferase [Anaerolineaceae bacterium]